MYTITIKSILIRIGYWIAQSLRMQLYITLISLPILVAWGLPLSLLSAVGNILFAPFITLFLVVSSLIFFAEIFSLPNGLFICFLEKVYYWWMSSMDILFFNPLVGFVQMPFYILVLLPVVTFVCLRCSWFQGLYRNSLLMLSLLFIFYLGNILFVSKMIDIVIPCNRGEVTVNVDNGKVTLFDPGVIGQRKSAYSWMMYTLLSEIVGKTGYTTIDDFRCDRLNKTMLQALILFVQQGPVKNLKYKRIDKKNNDLLKELEKVCEDNGVGLDIC